MQKTCSICGTAYPEGASCPQHPATIATSPQDTLDDNNQGDGLPTVSDAQQPPRIMAGEYILEKKLGEGGMGEVWQGLHPKINKKVAVKILHSKFMSNQQVLSRFMREAQAISQVDHKNLVDIFTFGDLADGRPYFVMEYLQGKSLKEYIKKRGVLPLGEILVIMRQLCRALDTAHKQGVIHRDLKPDNLYLLLDDPSQPFLKILDFGIAKLTDTPEAQALTRTGMIFGTPAYMSPEQCEGAKNVDHRSDLYAVGVLLYEMLTGKNPFKSKGDSIASVLKKQIAMNPPPPSAEAKGRHFPALLDSVVLRALEKEPAKRYQRCQDLYDTLEKALENKESEADAGRESATIVNTEGALSPEIRDQLLTTAKLRRQETPKEPPKEPPPKPSSSKTLALIFLAAIVVGGSAGYLIVSRLSNASVNNQPPPTPTTTPIEKKEPLSTPVSKPVPAASSTSQSAPATVPSKIPSKDPKKNGKEKTPSESSLIETPTHVVTPPKQPDEPPPADENDTIKPAAFKKAPSTSQPQK